MKKQFLVKISIMLFMGLCVFSACKKKPVDIITKVKVNIQAVVEGEHNLEGVVVTLEDKRTQEKITGVLDAKNSCELTIDKGTYTIEIKGEIKKHFVFGNKENFSIAKEGPINIDVTLTEKPAEKVDVVIKPTIESQYESFLEGCEVMIKSHASNVITKDSIGSDKTCTVQLFPGVYDFSIQKEMYDLSIFGRVDSIVVTDEGGAFEIALIAKEIMHQFALTIKADIEGSYNLEGFDLFAEDLKTQKITSGKFSQENSCVLTLEEGTYKITVNAIVEDENYTHGFSGLVENFELKEETTVNIPISVLSSVDYDNLIFSEQFFNGGTYNGQMMHPDQYMVLFNNGDKGIYVDGVTLAITEHLNPIAHTPSLELLPDYIVVRGMYTIPGGGKDHLLLPGKHFVIARTALNHGATFATAEGHPAADLSGADFEVYNPDLPANWGADVDNPDVPNMIITFGGLGDMLGHPKGFVPMFMFHPMEDMGTFLQNNQYEYTDGEGNLLKKYKVASNLVIDGIEASQEGYLKAKAFPSSVDEDYIGVSGCHRQDLVKRKILKEENGRTYYQDTNNSRVDCEVVKGVSHFPAGRRK